MPELSIPPAPLPLFAPTGAAALELTRIGRSKVLAIGGGKGGTGKSLLATNIGLWLAERGREVVLLDADLGGANQHTCLGIASPGVGLSDYLAGQVRSLEALRCYTAYPRLSLINGAKDALGIANLRYVQKKKIVDHVRRLRADVVILDLGAGTASNMVDFFGIADLGLVVVNAEPTSIENAYRFVRAALLRRIQHLLAAPAAREILDRELTAGRSGPRQSPAELFDRIRAADRASFETIEMALAATHLALVFNMMREEEDFRIGQAMERACRDYFRLAIPFLGGIRYDDAVWRSVRRRRPFYAAERGCGAARDLDQLAGDLHQRLFQRSA
jgi:flagellar biosynthesis protein FlhG